MKRAFSRKNLWDKTPAPAKAVIGSVLSLIPLPYVLGAEFRHWYQFAREADRWDSERIHVYQLVQLRRILKLAYERTEFYRESFRSVGFEPGDFKAPGDLQRLPTVDKTTIRENWQRMLTRPITDPEVDLVTTGGTSGEPLRFYMSSARHAPEFAHLTACWLRVGYKPGDHVAVLRGRIITAPIGGAYRQYDPLLRHHYYSTFHMTPEQMRKYVEHMCTIEPKYLHAYPSALLAMARFVRSEKLTFPASLQAALLESEPILPDQRAWLQSECGLRVFSAYGLSEKVILAAECERSHIYHVMPTYGYCEVVDAQGTAVTSGQHGELTGTSFIDGTMPFIRYRTGDDARVLGEKCGACGRNLLLFDEIQPRRGQEFLLCRDGRTRISMAALNLHDDTFDGITRFQFIQEEPGKAVLALVPANGCKQDAGRIQRHFAPKLSHGVDLEVRFVNEVALTRVGKQPLIVQRCPGISEVVRHPTS